MGRGNKNSFTNNDISSFMTCNRMLDNTTGDKGGTGTDYKHFFFLSNQPMISNDE
jgi:hypothetical protein